MIKLKSATRDEHGKRITKAKLIARSQTGGTLQHPPKFLTGFRKRTKSQRKEAKRLVKGYDATGKLKPLTEQDYDLEMGYAQQVAFIKRGIAHNLNKFSKII